MRLPGSKLWRAFPELDRFDDEQCRGLLGRTISKNKLGMVAMVPLGIVTCFVVWTICGAVGSALMAGLQSLARDEHIPWMLSTVLHVVVLVPVAASGPLAGLAVRDSFLRSRLQETLADRLCGCGYSLLGLRIEGERVQCPECGSWADLAVRQELAADLRALSPLGPAEA